MNKYSENVPTSSAMACFVEYLARKPNSFPTVSYFNSGVYITCYTLFVLEYLKNMVTLI